MKGLMGMLGLGLQPDPETGKRRELGKRRKTIAGTSHGRANTDV